MSAYHLSDHRLLVMFHTHWQGPKTEQGGFLCTTVDFADSAGDVVRSEERCAPRPLRTHERYVVTFEFADVDPTWIFVITTRLPLDQGDILTAGTVGSANGPLLNR